MAEVGLIISADDKATEVLKSIGDVGKTAFTKLRSAVNGIGPAFQAVTDVMAKWNQVLDLGRKAMGLFRAVVSDNIAVALEFRKANDPVVKQFEEMDRSVKILKARIGDVFIPIIQGLADSFVNAGNGVVEFINANRKLIATNITTFLADTARVLIKGIAVGAIAASRAWSGWQEIIGLVQAGVETFFSVLLKANAASLGAMAKLAGFFNDDLAAAIQGVADSSAEMGAIFSESADENIRKVQEQIKAQDELEKKILKVSKTATQFVGEAEVKILDKIKNSRIGMNITRERSLELAELERQASEDAASALEAKMIATAALASSITSSIAQNFAAVADGTMGLNKAVASSTIETAETIILAAAASAAAKQLEAHSFIPFVGIAIGTAAAAAIFTLIKSQMAKFAFGGVVKGPRPGSDSVPAMLTPGERVLTPRQNKDFEAGNRGGGGPISVTVSPSFQNLTPPSSMAERKNLVLALAPEIEWAIRSGNMNLQGAGT